MILMNLIYIVIFTNNSFSFQVKYIIGVMLLIGLSLLNLIIDGKKSVIKLHEEYDDNK